MYPWYDTYSLLLIIVKIVTVYSTIAAVKWLATGQMMRWFGLRYVLSRRLLKIRLRHKNLFVPWWLCQPQIYPRRGQILRKYLWSVPGAKLNYFNNYYGRYDKSYYKNKKYNYNRLMMNIGTIPFENIGSRWPLSRYRLRILARDGPDHDTVWANAAENDRKFLLFNPSEVVPAAHWLLNKTVDVANKYDIYF